MKKELLIKYLKNNCTDDEFDEVVGWIKTEAQQKEAQSWSLDQWTMFEPEPGRKDEKKYLALLHKIHYEINLKHRNNKDSKVITLSKVTTWLSRAAAILFIPLIGVLFYLLSNNNFQFGKFADITVDSLEVIAPIGSRTVVQLSDGTEVNLNYGSKIKYPRNFIGDTREIILSGEAYFDVAHNQQKPFIVKTGKLDVKVLGTEFNVKAYPDDNFISTTLVKGSVALEKNLPGEKPKSIETMIPGQHITYNICSDKFTSTQGSIDKYIAWKEGRLVFDNESITDIAEQLERIFNVKIELDENVKYLTYSVTFFNDPLFLILDLMKETTPITYKVYPRKKQPDGTFSKQKIRIQKR
ncbi:MAG: FecR domain-containing protein [Bacteroidales bacterium]|nr:FecR domain-containing protein [Bacteroidales bacterium]